MSGDLTPVIVEAAITSQDVVNYITSPEQYPIQQLVEDPEVIAARIEAEELMAQTPAQLFGGQMNALHGEDVIGKTFQILSVSWRHSDFTENGGLPVFGVFTVAFADGQIETLVCGARSVVRKVAIAAARGWLPVWVKMEAIPSKEKGRKPILDLVAGENPSDEAPF